MTSIALIESAAARLAPHASVVVLEAEAALARLVRFFGAGLAAFLTGAAFFGAGFEAFLAGAFFAAFLAVAMVILLSSGSQTLKPVLD